MTGDQIANISTTCELDGYEDDIKHLTKVLGNHIAYYNLTLNCYTNKNIVSRNLLKQDMLRNAEAQTHYLNILLQHNVIQNTLRSALLILHMLNTVEIRVTLAQTSTYH